MYAQGASTLAKKCMQKDFACGECESELQTGLNEIINEITTAKLNTNNKWAESNNSENISMKPGVTLDDTLSKIIKLMKDNNELGENKLNFVVIGESESLQGSSVENGKIYPRIMLKSPSSELMVTFNTNPNDPGYKTIEIMRWIGREGKY